MIYLERVVVAVQLFSTLDDDQREAVVRFLIPDRICRLGEKDQRPWCQRNILYALLCRETRHLSDTLNPKEWGLHRQQRFLRGMQLIRMHKV